MRTNRSIYSLFFLSGFAALLYQVIWTKRLTLVFGVTSYAVGTSIAIFMLGLACGSRFFGKHADRSPSPLRMYMKLECGIAAAAAFSLLMLALLEWFVASLHLAGEGLFFRSLIRAVGSALVLLAPTFLMGGTLPALARHCIRSGQGAGRKLGWLYAVNAFGGAGGAFLSGFYFIPALGLRNTLLVGVLINILVVLLTAAILQKTADADGEESREGKGGEEASAWAVPDRRILATAMLGGFFAAGLAGLAAEVVWTRILVFFANETSQAFAIMLAVYLLGLVAGGASFGRMADRRKRPDRAYGIMLILSGFVIAAFLFIVVAVIDVGTPSRWVMSLAGWLPGPLRGIGVLECLRVSIFSFMLLFVPTLCMGAAFPFAARFFARDIDRLGTRLGFAVMLNTLGSTLGPLLWGFFLLPALGMQRALLLCVLLLCAAGGGVLGAGAERPRRAGAICMILLAALAISLFSLPEYVVSETYGERYKKILYYEEDLYGSTGVAEERKAGETYRRLIVGSTSMITDGFSARRYTRLIGHTPVLLHEKPRRALVICLGSGMTVSAIARHADIEAIDCVELSGAVVNIARRWFGEANEHVLDDPRVEIIVSDGRNYVMGTRRSYDIIAMEPPPPNNAGVAALYSREFYESCRARLNPGGMIMQWVPYHSVTLPQARRLFATMQAVFPESSVWQFYNGVEYCIVGHKGALRVPYGRIARRLAVPEVAAHLAEVGVRSVEEFAACFVMGPERLAEFTKGALLVTDNHPRIGYELDAYAFWHPDRQHVHGMVQYANLLTRRYAQPPLRLFAFETPAEKAVFQRRFEEVAREMRMQNSTTAYAVLPLQLFGEAESVFGVPEPVSYVPPVLLDRENPYYYNEFLGGLPETALYRLAEYSRKRSEEHMAEQYIEQAKTLGAWRKRALHLPDRE